MLLFTKNAVSCNNGDLARAYEEDNTVNKIIYFDNKRKQTEREVLTIMRSSEIGYKMKYSTNSNWDLLIDKKIQPSK